MSVLWGVSKRNSKWNDDFTIFEFFPTCPVSQEAITKPMQSYINLSDRNPTKTIAVGAIRPGRNPSGRNSNGKGTFVFARTLHDPSYYFFFCATFSSDSSILLPVDIFIQYRFGLTFNKFMEKNSSGKLPCSSSSISYRCSQSKVQMREFYLWRVLGPYIISDWKINNPAEINIMNYEACANFKRVRIFKRAGCARWVLFFARK